MASKKSISILKQYYNQLLIQIHPDYFHSDPGKKEWNQRTTSALNSLLEQLTDNPQTEAIHLKFYTKEGKLIEQVLDPFHGKSLLQLRKVDKVGLWSRTLLQLFKNCGVQVDSKHLVDFEASSHEPSKKERFAALFRESTRSAYWKQSKKY
jgi:hypothetical protein